MHDFSIPAGVQIECGFLSGGGSVKLGLVINPMAGIGGAVGLKGSDGREIVEQALDKGAHPHAQDRALTAVSRFKDCAPDMVYTAAGAMGHDVLINAVYDEYFSTIAEKADQLMTQMNMLMTGVPVVEM